MKKKTVLSITLIMATTALLCAQQFNPKSDFTVARIDGANAVSITGYTGTMQAGNRLTT